MQWAVGDVVWVYLYKFGAKHRPCIVAEVLDDLLLIIPCTYSKRMGGIKLSGNNRALISKAQYIHKKYAENFRSVEISQEDVNLAISILRERIECKSISIGQW